MTCGQDRVIITAVSLLRADIAYPAMTMLDVVPLHEAGGPGASRIEVGEAFGRELSSSTPTVATP